MTKLTTPFGCIEIRIDDLPVSYIAEKGAAIETICPDVLGRYQIDIAFIPDGKEHKILCTFSECRDYKRTPESGENLECQGFYNSERYKMSIGVICEAGYWPDGNRISGKYDYDAEYLENGMSYLIFENTKTQHFVFGIAWIDNVGWNDVIDGEHNRDVETWFGADPTLAL